MSYIDTHGVQRFDKTPMKVKVDLRTLQPTEKKRLDEIHFWLIIEQIKDSKASVAAPMGTTLPKMLATILGVNSGVIDYAYNAISLPANKPTNDEISLMLKTNKVSAASSMFTPDTYYKGLKRWKAEGQPTLIQTLSDIQHVQVLKFIKNYAKAFMGKRLMLAKLSKGKI